MSIVPHFNAPKPLDPVLEDAMRAAVLGLLGELIEASKMRSNRTIELADLERIAKHYKPIDRRPPAPAPPPPPPPPVVPMLRELAVDLGLKLEPIADRHVAFQNAIVDSLGGDRRTNDAVRVFAINVAAAAGEGAVPTELRRLRYALSGITQLARPSEGSAFELAASAIAPKVDHRARLAIGCWDEASWFQPERKWLLDMAAELQVDGSMHVAHLPPLSVVAAARDAHERRALEAARAKSTAEWESLRGRDLAAEREAEIAQAQQKAAAFAGGWGVYDEDMHSIAERYRALESRKRAGVDRARITTELDRLRARQAQAIGAAAVIDAAADKLQKTAPESLAFALVSSRRRAWDASAPDAGLTSWKAAPAEFIASLQALGVRLGAA